MGSLGGPGAPEVPGLPEFRWGYGIHWVLETLGVLDVPEFLRVPVVPEVLGVPEFHQDPGLPGIPVPQKTEALELMKALG